ncbi:hypothetical protein [Streptomyces zagrosensis]|uniref:Uncharacterized protein n=1 Tax=Streptomyces zagrosensis TaxID=1042984 RepID=A0A7W9UYW0_9ACTN|nr:hypothetical protein [Streptomyces zagrosensis]MBB5935776.1 hypothetical protein [Streptomyces zagrosensis]
MTRNAAPAPGRVRAIGSYAGYGVRGTGRGRQRVCATAAHAARHATRTAIHGASHDEIIGAIGAIGATGAVVDGVLNWAQQ